MAQKKKRTRKVIPKKDEASDEPPTKKAKISKEDLESEYDATYLNAIINECNIEINCVVENNNTNVFNRYEPPPVIAITHMIPTAAPGKLVLIGQYDGKCLIFDQNSQSQSKYKRIGYIPVTHGHGYDETGYEIIQLPHTNKNIIKLFTFASRIYHDGMPHVYPDEHHCFEIEININSHTIKSVVIGNSNYNMNSESVEIGNNIINKDNIYPWFYDCINCHACLATHNHNKILAISAVEEFIDDKSIDVINLDVDKCWVSTLKNVFPFKIGRRYIIPITNYCECTNCPNDYLLIAENTDNNSEIITMHLKFEEYAKRFRVVIDDVESDLMGNFQTEPNLYVMEYIVFNDYLLLFDVDVGSLDNQCHIFSFREMQWICFVTMPIEYRVATINISHGIIHFILQYFNRGSVHYGLDIGNMLNYRYQSFYAMLKGLYECKTFDTNLTICSNFCRIIFDFVDDIFIVQHLEKPWINTSRATNQHMIWFELESIFVCNKYQFFVNKINYNESLNIMKCIFQFIDDTTLEKHQLPKPWIDSFESLSHAIN
eukprot:321419_1